ncbi:MAG: hypothetical protein JKY32_08680 [Rhizobiales bacterium]|nr:hypothetical protein [Hyphomicrobiales bacterium]
MRFDKRAAIRAIKVAAIVGPVLTLINQWEGMVGAAPLVIWKIILTFIVPFLVSYFSAIMAQRES